MSSVMEKLQQARLMPVIVLDRAEDAWPLAQALKAGGLPVAEVPLRTAAAEAAIREIAKDKDIALGAGTILQPDQVDQAMAAGATYIVTPGFNAKVVRRCREKGIPVFPGIATPTEIQMALDEGVETVKFFPAESIGGIKALKAYFDVRPKTGSAALFLNRYGEPLGDRGVRKLVARYAQALGFTKRVTPHTQRHTYANAKAKQTVTVSRPAVRAAPFAVPIP